MACPVTVVRGHTMVAGPASFADRVADALPRGHLEAHDDLGHFGPLEAPGRMAASVQAVVDRRLSQPRPSTATSHPLRRVGACR